MIGMTRSLGAKLDNLLELYWDRSRQPLEVLVFLLPFIVTYELCLLSVLRAGDATITNRAHEGILQFFGIFGTKMLGLSLPGVAVVVVLLVWQSLTRTPWRLHWPTVLVMFVESALLTIPLLVLSRVIQQGLPLAADGGQLLEGLGSTGRVAVAIGAGLYEELVFRMMLIAIVHVVLVDFCRMASGWGYAIAVAISAILFTLYHPAVFESGALEPSRAVFFLLAGALFGTIFVVRGFGIVVAVHVFYDIVTLLGE